MALRGYSIMLRHFKEVYKSQNEYEELRYDLDKKPDWLDFDNECLCDKFGEFQINLKTFNNSHFIKYETILKYYRKHRARKFDRLCKRYGSIEKILNNFEKTLDKPI